MKPVGRGLLELCERLAANAPDFEEPPAPPPPTAEQSWMRWLEISGTPYRYQEVPMNMELHKDAKDWRGTPEFITFLGTVGTGKTWQATKLFGDVFAQLREEGPPPQYRVRAMWIDAARAVEVIRQQMATDQDGRMVKTLVECELLLLDDLLAERDTEFSRDKLGYILRQRHAERMATIITSNSVDAHGAPSLDAISKIDARLASRIGEGLVIKMGGRDRRLPARPLPVSHGKERR